MIRRLAYFSKAILNRFLPEYFHKTRTQNLLKSIQNGSPKIEIENQVSYLNKLNTIVDIKTNSTISAFSNSNRPSLYQLDLLEYARGFGRNLPIAYEFGDITHIPPVPTIVKSRPIKGKNQNSILFPLDKLRHLIFMEDKQPWENKKPFATYRGRPNNWKRTALVDQYYNHPNHDIGFVHAPDSPEKCRPWLSRKEQLDFRYILSIEGDDVATNLKWIMSSNSIAVSPPLVYETWFMEGLLKPGIHYIEIKEDVSDLEEKINYYEQHPKEALSIIENANNWTKKFANKETERLLATLVLKKYFEFTNSFLD